MVGRGEAPEDFTGLAFPPMTHQLRPTTPMHPILLSLEVALAALVLVFFSGTGLAAWLHRREFWGKTLVEALFLLPLVLPPVVTGYLLLLLMGKNGPVGIALHRAFDWSLLFTPWAAIIAAAVVAFPLMYQSAKAAFAALDTAWQDAARSLGARPLTVFWTIILPLSWHGLAAGALLSFARALGEFGATIMVAGNIAGKTTTMPTAIYTAAEGGDFGTAGLYALVLGVFNFGFVLALSIWARCSHR